MSRLSRRQRVHLAQLEAHPAPHHRAIATLAHRFNADPAFQYKLHLAGTYVFIAQIPVVLGATYLLPSFWKAVGVTYIAVISLLANAQTEACNLPSAEAAMAAQANRRALATDIPALERDIARLAALQPGPESDLLAAEIRKRVCG